MFQFYTPWKRQNTFDFLTFLGGIEMELWLGWNELSEEIALQSLN